MRLKRMSNVFLDVFTLRRYESLEDLVELIGVKKNGLPQSDDYVRGILDKITAAANKGACGGGGGEHEDNGSSSSSSSSSRGSGEGAGDVVAPVVPME